MTSPSYYPVFLTLKSKRCIVVGGGKVAERKALSLLRSDADVTIISPAITQRLEREKLKGRLRHVCRAYKKGDLKNAFLVIAATDDSKVNQKISRDSPSLVNVVDVPSLCNFIVPSVVKRGPLTIAVSTSGVSPSTAKAIRKELEYLYGPAFGRHLNSFKKVRAKVMVEIKDKKERKRFLKKSAAHAFKKLRLDLYPQKTL